MSTRDSNHDTASEPPEKRDPPADRLDSWKEIAEYVRRGVRTVQRWERDGGLPVHRLNRDKRSVVFAFRSEIDNWWISQGGEKEEEDSGLPIATDTSGSPSPPEPKPGAHRWFIASPNLIWILVLLLAAGAWILSSIGRQQSPGAAPREITLPPNPAAPPTRS